MKHTPGPWESLDDCVRVNRPGDPDHHMMVCSIPGFLTGDIASARLIAAAPELVEALKALYEHTKNNYQICGINAKAKAAIAKALGGSRE